MREEVQLLEVFVLGKCSFEKVLQVCCTQEIFCSFILLLMLFVLKHRLQVDLVYTSSFSANEKFFIVCCEEILQFSRVQNVFFNICRAFAAWEVNVL